VSSVKLRFGATVSRTTFLSFENLSPALHGSKKKLLRASLIEIGAGKILSLFQLFQLLRDKTIFPLVLARALRGSL